MTRFSFALTAVLVGLLACSSPASAACGLTSATYTYWPPSPSTFLPNDPRCSLGGYCNQEGVLYTPSGPSSGLPVLIYIHGSGKQHNSSDMCAMISYFVDRHYVVFHPYLRGVGNTAGTISSTGTYIGDWVDENSFLCGPFQTAADCNAWLNVLYMRQEVADVREMVKFLGRLRNAEGLKLIDPSKIALSGHSFGGALVTLASSMWPNADIRPAVTIDMSGGVLSWHSSWIWPDALNSAAGAHQMPIFMFQTTNESPAFVLSADQAIQSTVQPFLHADGHGTGEAEMVVFSKVKGLEPTCVMNQGETECAHLQFVQDAVQVNRWAPQVRDFMRRHGVK